MDRSARATHARRLVLLLIALTALVGCQGRTSAPAAVAAKTEEHLQRRLPPAKLATLPIAGNADFLAASLSDVQTGGNAAPPADFVHLEPVASATEVPALLAAAPKTDIPASKPQPTDFAINEEPPSQPKETSGALQTETHSQETPAPTTREIPAPQANQTSIAPAQEGSTLQVKQVSAEPLKADPAPAQTPAPAPSDQAARTAATPAAPTVTLAARPADPTAVTPLVRLAEKPIAEPAPAAEEPATAESQLPWGPSTPTAEMIAISKRAEETARHGFDLAERGALYTARAQFIEVLRSMAQAIDSQRNSTAHTKALAAGLRAMEEVDDFVPRGTRLESDLNLKLIVDAHRTPVLKDRSLDDVTVTEAQRLYLTYAQEHLAAAAGDQPVASLALYGLGKVCAAPAAMHGPHERIAECKAVVFYQAALVAEPRNFLSANELGVLLARFGRLDDARTVLERAVAVSNAPTSWRNLATVYERLGNAPQAQQARQQADVAVAQLHHQGYASAGMKYPINWLDPDVFARTNSMTGDTQSVAAPQPTQQSQQPTPAVPQTAANPDKKSGLWPWTLR